MSTVGEEEAPGSVLGVQEEEEHGKDREEDGCSCQGEGVGSETGRTPAAGGREEGCHGIVMYRQAVDCTFVPGKHLDERPELQTG